MFTSNGYNNTLGGTDYVSKPNHTVIFPAGKTHATLNISIYEDNVFENNESFTLTINTSSLPSGVTRGDPGKTTVTIVDNDGK